MTTASAYLPLWIMPAAGVLILLAVVIYLAYDKRKRSAERQHIPPAE